MSDAFDGPFELDRLVSYDEASLIAEMKRVAALIERKNITRSDFSRLARASTDTYLRRFGGWKEALEAADLGHRYGGRRVSPKMRDQRARYASRSDMVAELKRIAADLDTDTLRRSDLLEHSTLLGERAVLNRFGSWQQALDAAGLKLSPHGRRWSEDDYFDNLLEVWTHHGRVPTYAEMDQPPSRITSGGYATRFGSWGRAKAAFIDRINSDLEQFGESHIAPTPATAIAPTPTTRRVDRGSVTVGLRYTVLNRDRFRCVKCARSPATELGCVLHVDHITPLSKGGTTEVDNLRSLCGRCNLGRGNRFDD